MHAPLAFTERNISVDFRESRGEGSAEMPACDRSKPAGLGQQTDTEGLVSSPGSKAPWASVWLPNSPVGPRWLG